MTGGSIADGNITLINQRHVGDDLPVNFFYVFTVTQIYTVKFQIINFLKKDFLDLGYCICYVVLCFLGLLKRDFQFHRIFLVASHSVEI